MIIKLFRYCKVQRVKKVKILKEIANETKNGYIFLIHLKFISIKP